jgi:hypothetical protein
LAGLMRHRRHEGDELSSAVCSRRAQEGGTPWCPGLPTHTGTRRRHPMANASCAGHLTGTGMAPPSNLRYMGATGALHGERQPGVPGGRRVQLRATAGSCGSWRAATCTEQPACGGVSLRKGGTNPRRRRLVHPANANRKGTLRSLHKGPGAGPVPRTCMGMKPSQETT